MAVPVHARLRVGGQLYADASWSIGCAFSTEEGGDPFANLTQNVQTALEFWRDQVKALHNGDVLTGRMRDALSSSATVGFIRCSRIGQDGKETAVALVEINPQRAGTASAKHDAQTACAVSLQTGRPGASYRGRLYLPAVGMGLEQGRLSALDASNLATDVATWLHEVADATGDFGGALNVVPSVVSTVKGVATRIRSVRVGNRLDSQRRRAEGQDEVYSVAPVAQ